MRIPLAAALGLASLVLGCGSRLVPAPHEDPTLLPDEELDGCDVPDLCSGRVEMLGCFGLTYEEHHVCHFEALVGESPAMIRAASVNFCSDPTYVVEHVEIYRWADGSMTCAFGEVELEQIGLDLGTPDEVEAYECELSDPSMFELCLADARAGAPTTPTTFLECMEWKQWGIEIGDPIDLVCR